jgi:hypothetical protein
MWRVRVRPDCHQISTACYIARRTFAAKSIFG